MNMRSDDQYDLIIIGAGMVGSALAIALRGAGIKTAIIESYSFKASNTSSFDDRNLVLSLSSQRILQQMQLWNGVSANSTPVKTIHISEQGRFASVLLEARQMGLDALAYSLKARELGQNFHAEFSNIANLRLLCPATVVDIQQDTGFASVHIEQNNERRILTGRLLVVADGSDSTGRQLLGIEAHSKAYNQHAIVCNVETELGHHNTAYERFNQYGPVALLPTATDHQCGLVYVVPDTMLQQYLEMSDDDFLHAATRRFSRRLGRFLKLSTRRDYPLRLITVSDHIKGRALLLGNSAHTVHPNAAQGFNLGLRDVACLAECLINARQQQQDIGARSLLQGYIDMRKTDHNQVIQFTDGLARLFYNDNVITSKLRNYLMLMTEHLPILKQSLMIRAMGLYGQQASIV